MYETGSKAANPPLFNMYLFKNMKLGMPQNRGHSRFVNVVNYMIITQAISW